MSVNASTDTPIKAVLTAGLVAFVCALIVSVAAVSLRPYQDANRAAEREGRILAIIKGIPGMENLADAGGAKAWVVELGTDNLDARANPDVVDVDAQLKDPEQSIALNAKDDIAGLKRRENRQVIYAVLDPTGRPQALVLPVRGLGYASVLKGFLAMSADGSTILGIGFYEHGETPGLGARIDDASWKAKWVGKQAFNEQGDLAIEVVQGEARADFQVDAISGATRTSNAVGAMVRFWLGPQGFGPLLARLRGG